METLNNAPLINQFAMDVQKCAHWYSVHVLESLGMIVYAPTPKNETVFFFFQIIIVMYDPSHRVVHSSTCYRQEQHELRIVIVLSPGRNHQFIVTV